MVPSQSLMGSSLYQHNPDSIQRPTLWISGVGPLPLRWSPSGDSMRHGLASMVFHGSPEGKCAEAVLAVGLLRDPLTHAER